MQKIPVKYIAAILIIGILLFEAYTHEHLLIHLLTQLQTFSGIQLLVIFCVLYIVSSLLLLPIGLPLNLFAGLTWGILGGGILVNMLATFVAAISFLLARHYGHTWLKKAFSEKPMLRSLQETINRYDWQFISMARINPVIPFSLSNYLFGLIPELSFIHYITATILANLLPCFIFAAIGSVVKTFTLEGNNQIHYFILKTGMVILLISLLLTIKMFLTNRQKHFPIKKEAV